MEAVYAALNGTLSSDAQERIEAENTLKTLAGSSALLLKNYIDTHWSAKLEKYMGPEPTEESKAIVRERAIRGLSEPETKIRIVCASVVSKIAHNDWPEDWPNLFDGLLGLVRNGNDDEVHGAMRVLSEFVTNDVTDQQFPQIAPALCPELLRILVDPSSFSYRTRGRAIAIFRHCVEMLFTLKEEHPNVADHFLAPLMSSWMDAFLAVLSAHITSDKPEEQAQDYGLKLEVIKTLNLIMQGFGKYIVPYLGRCLEPIWRDLLELRQRFLNEYVIASDVDHPTYQDSDGDAYGFEPLLYASFEFLGLACRKKGAREIFLGADGRGAFLEEVVYTCITYMQMTEEQVDTWLSDANQYVADEEEDSFAYNIRIASTDLLFVMLQKYPQNLFLALSQATQRHLTESNQQRAANKPEWWKVQEACLLAIGKASDELVESLQDSSSGIQFDLEGLFQHVVLESMRDMEHPFRQGRAFVFASEFASILPAHLSSQYVAAAATALQTPDASIPVRASALRALNNYCKHLDVDIVKPHAETILSGACQLLPHASEDSLILVVETLMSAAKLDEQVTAQSESVVVPLILDVWKKNPADHVIPGIIMDLIESLAKLPMVYPGLSARTLPVLHSILVSGTNDDPAVSSAINLVTGLIRGGTSPLPIDYSQQIFPPIMHILMKTDDRDILQSGQDLLKNFIAKDCDNLLAYRDAEGNSGLEMIMHFVAKLLDPQQSESAALFVGDVVIKLIKKAGNNINHVLPDLLRAIVQRLKAAATPTFTQSLVLVFAHLINSQMETVINFLADLQVQGQSGLETLMNAWCDNAESFQGEYSQKVSAVALSNLFISGDQRLAALQVKGDLIPNDDGKIMTRSRTKKAPDQYTQLALPVKIIKMLVSDLQDAIDADRPEGDEEEEESEDEVSGQDWEDVEDSPFVPAEEFAFLSDFLEGGIDFEEDTEENDPDLATDPIYQMNLKDFLMTTFKQCASNNTNHFVDICQHYLNGEEQERINMVMNS